MIYLELSYSNSSFTTVGVLLSAYFDLSISVFLDVPLGSPNNANVIASNMVVFQAPVSTEIRYRPFFPNLVKSISVVPAYGPKADIVSFSGLIQLPPIF